MPGRCNATRPPFEPMADPSWVLVALSASRVGNRLLPERLAASSPACSPRLRGSRSRNRIADDLQMEAAECLRAGYVIGGDVDRVRTNHGSDRGDEPGHLGVKGAGQTDRRDVCTVTFRSKKIRKLPAVLSTLPCTLVACAPRTIVGGVTLPFTTACPPSSALNEGHLPFDDLACHAVLQTFAG